MEQRLPDEPEGWRELRDRAQQEKDPKKLAAILEQMNQLLAHSEKRQKKDAG